VVPWRGCLLTRLTPRCRVPGAHGAARPRRQDTASPPPRPGPTHPLGATGEPQPSHALLTRAADDTIDHENRPEPGHSRGRGAGTVQTSAGAVCSVFSRRRVT